MVLKDEIKRLPVCVRFEFLVADTTDKLIELVDKAKMLFTLTALTNVTDNLFKSTDVASVTVPNENKAVYEYFQVEMTSKGLEEHSTTRLDSWEPDLLKIDRSVTALLQEENP